MIVKEPEQSFVQAPAGVYSAVCVDEVDMGPVANRFEPEKDPVPTVRLVWQIDEDQPDGKPYMIKKDYRASLHEKAGLRKDLDAWRGRPFSFDELAGFDLENVIGACCMLNIVEKAGTRNPNRKFSNIASITPLPKGMHKIAPRDYVRMKDRQPAQKNHEEMPPSHDISDDDVPF